MNKIEKLIKKLTDRWYKHPAQKSIPISSVKKMIASLQEPTKEREVTLKISDLEWFEYEWCYCKCWHIIAENQEECDCWAKIKRIP